MLFLFLLVGIYCYYKTFSKSAAATKIADLIRLHPFAVVPCVLENTEYKVHFDFIKK